MMKVLLTLFAVLLLFAALVRLLEQKMVFYPVKFPNGYWHPEKFGLDVEDIYFDTSDDVRLHGWLVQSDTAVATVLWCHGNAGNISDRLDNLARLAETPLNVFIFDYRGYGRSTGVPAESGVYLDAEAAYDYLISERRVKPSRLIIFGRSLGGAVAADLATKRASAGLVLESTFTSAADMAKGLIPFVPLDWIIKTKFETERKVPLIQVPVLAIHGDADEIVPFDLGKKVFDTANQPKSFYTIKGAGHNDTYVVGGQEYFRRLQNFIKNCLKTNPAKQ